jgi:hypothetical protein
MDGAKNEGKMLKNGNNQKNPDAMQLEIEKDNIK